MKRNLITLVLFLFCSINFAQAQKKQTPTFFSGTFDEALREARKLQKPLLLDFWAAWCAPCKKMDSETFANKEFLNFTDSNVLVYKIDIDSFEGMEIVEKYNVEVFPSFILLDHKKKKLASYKGFMPALYFQKELVKVFMNEGIYIRTESDGVLVRK